MNATARELEARHLVPVYGQLDIEPDVGAGVYLRDGDRQYIDFYGGHAVAALGYGHPALTEALEKQARSLMFQSNAVAMRVRARAAEDLVSFAPNGLDAAFFCNSGAEANENALRIACRLTGRDRIVALEHGFHGRTAGAAAVSWGAAQKWYGFPRAPFDVTFVPRDDQNAARAAIGDDTAAVVLELVQGLGGAYDLDPKFVDAVSTACEQSGALLIVDEVQTGMGRTGAAFASDLYSLQPDMLTTAKALGGGFPCAALLVSGEIAGELQSGDLGSTFGGGPMACALISATIDTIRSENLLDNVKTLSHRIATSIPLSGVVQSISGKGFLLGLHCQLAAGDMQRRLLDAGMIVGTSAVPNVTRLLPPLTLESQHVDELLAALAAIDAQ